MVRLAEISFACEDPERLRDFWVVALGYAAVEVSEQLREDMRAAGMDPDGIAAASDPSERGPKLFFERKPKRPEREGTHLPLHLDIEAEDRHAHVARLTKLGGTIVEEKSKRVGKRLFEWTVMRDPEGNGFCIEQKAGQS